MSHELGDVVANEERKNDMSDIKYRTRAFLVAVTIALLVFFGAFWLLNRLLEVVTEGWRGFPQSVATPVGAAVTAIIVLGVGLAFYLLREYARAMYAAIELAVAAFTAYRSSKFVTTVSSDRLQWLLALMASVYIAVRGYDNLRMAIRAKKSRTQSAVLEKGSDARAH